MERKEWLQRKNEWLKQTKKQILKSPLILEYGQFEEAEELLEVIQELTQENQEEIEQLNQEEK